MKKQKMRGVTSSLYEGNLEHVCKGYFCGIADEVAAIREAEENGGVFVMDSEGILQPRETIGAARGESITNPNLIRTAEGVLAANEMQWYKRNPKLFASEIAGMHKYYPHAKLSYLKDGRAYWRIKLKIKVGDIHTCDLALVYDTDHPHVSDDDWGGSCKVFPVKPTVDEIFEEAARHGRGHVPHIAPQKGNDGRYLCTVHPKNCMRKNGEIVSAVTSATWAAKWLYYFYTGLEDDECWENFCKHEKP